MEKVTKSTKVTFNPADKVRTSNKFAWSTGMILVGLLLGWIILIWTGNSPLVYFQSLIQGNFGSVNGFTNLIGTMSWMLPLGLAMVVSFRAGQFNIGASGQMILGGMMGYLFAVNVDIGRVGILFSLLIPVFSGMVVAYIIGKLKTQFKIHEVITSIMFNWIIFYALSLLTNASYFPQYQTAQGAMMPILDSNTLQASWMSSLVPNTTMNWGIFIAVGLLVVFIFGYKYTTWGTKQDIIGKNATAADYIGINKKKELVKTMVISGALAGLAGSIYYLGVQETLLKPGLDIPAEGFQGITLSLIAFNSPVGLIGSTFFVSAMNNASQLIEANGINPYVTDAVLALTIFGASLANFFVIYRPHDKILNWLDEGRKNRKPNLKREEKRKEKEAKAAEKAKAKNASYKSKSEKTKENKKIKMPSFGSKKGGEK